MINSEYCIEVPFDLYEGSQRPVYMLVSRDGTLLASEDSMRQEFAAHGRDWFTGADLYMVMPGTFEIIPAMLNVEQVTPKEEIEEWADYYGIKFLARARRISDGQPIMGADYKPVVIEFTEGVYIPAEIQEKHK